MSRKGKYHFKCIVNPSLPQLIILFRQEWMSKASHDGIRVYSQTRVLKGDDFKFRVSLSKMVRPNPPPTPIPQKKWNECWVLLSYIWHIKYSINIKFIPSWFFFSPLQDRVSHSAFNSLANWGKHSIPLSWPPKCWDYRVCNQWPHNQCQKLLLQPSGSLR